MATARTFAVGDLHGCLEPLERLLGRLGFDAASDRLWFVGDLVNRGPDSLGTLRRVMGLGDAATVVLGNHDLHLLALVHGLRDRSKKDTMDDVLGAPDRDDIIDWLRRRPLLHVDDASADAASSGDAGGTGGTGQMLVHAGISPEWTLDDAREQADALERVLRGDDYVDFLKKMYGNVPARWRDASTRTERLRYTVNAFTRMRFCRADGALDFAENGPPAQVPGLVPWYRVASRRPIDRPILFGHWSSHPAMAPAGIVPLDRGCVWGGTLAGFRVDAGAVEASAMSVPADVTP